MPMSNGFVVKRRSGDTTKIAEGAKWLLMRRVLLLFVLALPAVGCYIWIFGFA